MRVLRTLCDYKAMQALPLEETRKSGAHEFCRVQGEGVGFKVSSLSMKVV